MPHIYDDRFFRWVDLTATRSARAMLPVVREAIPVTSVVDVGCGQGAWLSVWGELGVSDVFGVDGSYVDQSRLAVPADRFAVADLAQPLSVGRRFDLAQSLEVAEHLPMAAARDFVAGLCGLSDVVLFSAAQPGQGGEAHVNERPPSYWASLFQGHGYAAFDAVRPSLAANRSVAPWYRFNTVLFANAAGAARLSPMARAAGVDDLRRLDAAGDLPWRVRRLVLRPLPVGVVSWLSRARYRVACSLEPA